MNIIDRINAVLKKRKESVVFDLYLKDYDKSNFYFALVFNKKIEKFKILYVPIDAVSEGEDIGEYFCYQFIFLDTVNYLLETIHMNEKIYKDEKFRIRHNKNMDSYYIEMNTHVASHDYKFTFSQYIDKDFIFFFDLIVVLFEHLPHIVSEICNKLLVAFNSSSEAIKYTNSFEMDLNSLDLFSSDVINNCHYTLDDISFIESVGNRYYAVIDDKSIVIDYYDYKHIFNVSCGDLDPLGEEVYTVCLGIKEELEKKFYRLLAVENTRDFSIGDSFINYYFCYGREKDKFKVIESDNHREVLLSEMNDNLVKISNADDTFKNEILEYLNDNYSKERVQEITEFVFI
jgi:hypothetical protein